MLGFGNSLDFKEYRCDFKVHLHPGLFITLVLGVGSDLEDPRVL